MHYAYLEEGKISVEPVCYEPDHIEQVLTEIRANFHDYFRKFVETENGHSLDENGLCKLAEKFNVQKSNKKKNVDTKAILTRIIDEEVNSFEKDRHNYLEFLDLEYLEEYKTDPPDFKNTVLRNQCPIIRYTLQNKKAKELDKYRKAFKYSDPKELLDVVFNITNFAMDYAENTFDQADFENAKTVKDLQFPELNKEDYVVYGVIGGGIRSHFMYKLFPYIFPNRSRDAVWALWYITDKKPFSCKQDSEFLMIELNDSITQQNYFYPYDLFSFYAIQILSLLKTEAKNNGVEIPEQYKFVFVDTFLSFVAKEHQDEINDLKRKVKDDGYN